MQGKFGLVKSQKVSAQVLRFEASEEVKGCRKEKKTLPIYQISR